MTRPASALATAAFAMLCAAAPASAVTLTSGMTLYGSLETVWSSDLGVRYSQSLHPTAASPGNGSTTPVTPDNYQFTGESITASLAARGISGTIDVSAPLAGNVDGQLYHLQVVLEPPAVGYYGLGMGSVIGGYIYVSGGSSNQLYYGLRESESTVGGADGGNTQNAHTAYTLFNGSYSNTTQASNFSVDSFGSTTVHTWSGGSVVNSPNGNGFVSIVLEPSAMHGSGGVGPGQTTTYDLWLSLSSTPVTALPAVPEPDSWALMLAGTGLLGWIGRRRLRQH